MNSDKQSLMFPFSTTSARGIRRGRRASPGSSSSLIKWVRAGFMILGVCRAIFADSTRSAVSPEEEREVLKKEAENLKKRFAVIEKRVVELEKEPALKSIGRDGNEKSNKSTVEYSEKIDEVFQS